jgi:hypothetical protein
MISALSFFGTLNWIDGKPLQIEPYRQDLFRRALDTYRDDGVPQYTLVLAGRAKKNNKSTDLILAGLFVLMCRESPQGSDVLLVANDKDQAEQDLDLAKKIIAANPDLAEELECLTDEIRRKDGKGTMRVLPANNVVGQHGKTAAFIGFDEIHGYRDYALLEALAPDPTRYCLTWITSYDTILDAPGVPLHDYKQIGIASTDERMLFSWYSADLCTDPNFANLEPELRANPSMASWPEGRAYLDQQRRRLPSARFRRLHHNLPGAPQGAFFDQAAIERAIVAGRQVIEPQDEIEYLAACDMSGGSSDDATLAISHWNGSKAVLDLVIDQGEPTPFNPRLAVARFAVVCARYRCREVHGDAYAGETFRRDFSDCGIDYIVEKQTRTDFYEAVEVALNADQIELLDVAKLRRQLLTIVRKGASLDHQAGQHDDWATSAACALTLVNPNLGGLEPGILTFYRRQVEAAAEAAATPQPAPTVAAAHAKLGFMQGFGPRQVEDAVRVVAPAGNETGTMHAASGIQYHATIEEDGQRVFYISRADAGVLLASPIATNLGWIGSNQVLSIELAEELRKSPPEPRGIRVVDMLRAAEDARPRRWDDKWGHAADTLRMIGRSL